MHRGEVWTVAGGPGYAGKPRPAVIVQDDAFADTASVTICGFTSDDAETTLFRIPVEAGAGSGLRVRSYLMVEKITTVPRSRLGRRMGRLAEEDVRLLDRAIVVFLGLGI